MTFNEATDTIPGGWTLIMTSTSSTGGSEETTMSAEETFDSEGNV